MHLFVDLFVVDLFIEELDLSALGHMMTFMLPL